MKSKHLISLLCLILCLVVSLSFSGCGLLATESDDEDAVTNTIQASAGGADITLPEDFVMPDTPNKMEGALVEDAYSGVIHLSSYRTGSYVFINGDSLTVDVNLYLTDSNGESVKTQYQDVKIALWEKGESSATYKDTAHFNADGTAQTYTFSGLKAGGEYRISITYSDVPSYRVNGKFRLTSVSATGSQEETAAAE